MGAITYFQLTAPADADLSEIYDYTLSAHGRTQAVAYLTGLDACFSRLVDHPELGRAREEIWSGLRSIAYEQHLIFYRIHADYIRIVRVLHGSRDLPNFLREE